jgi:hypothetical protein
MATDNLRNLALRVRRYRQPNEDDVNLSSKTWQTEILALPESLQSEVGELLTELGETIPNDFSFFVSFDADGIFLGIDFDDGNTSSSAGQHRFTSRKSMGRKLRATDWDALRSQLIEEGGIFEKLVSDAADRPVNIPSSKDAAEYYADQLNSIRSELKRATRTVPFLLVTASDQKGVYIEDLPDRGRVVYEIAEYMTFGGEILAVIEDGVWWPFDAIEAAKLEAVEQLGPISRAKAERRFFAP